MNTLQEMYYHNVDNNGNDSVDSKGTIKLIAVRFHGDASISPTPVILYQPSIDFFDIE